MSLRNLTKVPKRSLVYFSIDQSTCIVDTKKLRMKDSGQPFTNSAPQKNAEVMIKFGITELDAIVIASDGELKFFIYILFSVVFDVV